MKIPLLFALLAGSVVSQYAFADVCKTLTVYLPVLITI